MEYLHSMLTTAIPMKIWHFLIVAFLIANLKCLPLAWHFRLARAFYAHFPYHRYSARHSALIFQPVITSSRSPILECDYNLHKSNSTYFTDLDISRGHLLTCLLGHGMNKTRLARGGDDGVSQGSFGFHLGGVTCHFRREVRPFEAFEVWTRVLCWDEKWLYLVSHVVKAARVRPRSYFLQPWRKGRGKRDGPAGSGREGASLVIFASSIAKYVFKRGRRTIAPKTVLEQANLLPIKPEEVKASSSPHPTLDECDSINGAPWPIAQLRHRADAGAMMDVTLDVNLETDSWDWNRVEEERTRGMQMATFMAGLDGLDEEFTGESQNALGQF